MKISTNKRVYLAILLSLPGIFSLFIKIEIVQLKYSIATLLITCIIVFLLMFILTKQVLTRINLDLSLILWLLTVFFCLNGILIVISFLITGLNPSLGVLLFTYGLGLYYGNKSTASSHPRL